MLNNSKRIFLTLALTTLFFIGLILFLDNVFVIFSPPKIVNFQYGEHLVINFSKPVKRQELEHAIFPEAYGEWKFENPLIKRHLFKTLVFIPAINLEPSTEYRIDLKNIKGFGFGIAGSSQFIFKTRSILEKKTEGVGEEEKAEKSAEAETPSITLIDIPIDWQDYALSCEAASLKMALAAKEILVSENKIMDKIGFDSTPHKGNIWGNPYEKYVGNIDGKMCDTGYGVYWEPVAKAAQNWRPAEAFSFWGIEKLIEEIKNGNPVIFWGVLPDKNLTNCSWQTASGEYIKAFKETHVRLIVGFIGSENNPQKIIINDPLSGRLYWQVDYFLENWKVFDYSGVVVK